MLYYYSSKRLKKTVSIEWSNYLESHLHTILLKNSKFCYLCTHNRKSLKFPFDIHSNHLERDFYDTVHYIFSCTISNI